MPSPAPNLLQRLKGFFGPDDSAQNASQDPAVGTFAQAAPQVIQQSTDTLNPAYASPSSKESREPSLSLERPQVDMVGGLQSVEQERVAEISPEVESFITEVGEHQDQLPQEIVIADLPSPVPTTKYLAKPVVILPITPEIEKVGAKKAPQFSVRWLVEWSRKMMKVFAGEVVYKEASSK
ncbi:hypothetical protein BH10PAT2_BH10PAT2_1780 [soil metagenome]